MVVTAIITPTTLLNMPPNTHSRTYAHPVNDNPKTNTDILHANRALSKEISNTMPTKTRVEIELSPLAWEWMRISSGTQHYQPAKRVIADVNNAREQGLYDLPSQRIDEVVVKLYAPMSDNPGQLFILFDKVINLVDMLRRAPAIQKMSIVLETLDGQEWHHEQVTIGGVKESFFVPWADDCDIVVVLFCSLKNVGDVSVRGHSRELERLIDWKVIDWAVGVVREKSWEKYVPDPTRARATRRFDTTTYYASYTHRPDRSTPGTDVDRKVAEYCLRVHVNLMRHDFRDTGCHQRRDLLKQSFIYGGKSMNTPPSPFEHDMILIAKGYPDLLRKYDHAIEVFLHLQRIVVCAYERTKPGTHNDTNIITQFYNWDEAAWELVVSAFGDPLPNMGSWVYKECAAELGSFVDYNECLGRVEEEGKSDWLVEVVGVGQFLQDWVREFVYGEDGEDEYGEAYDEENVDEEDEGVESEDGGEDEVEEDEEEKQGEDVEEEDKEDESVENEGKDGEFDEEVGLRDEDDGDDGDDGDDERQDEAKDEEAQDEENVVEDDKKEDNDQGEDEDEEGEAYYEDDDDWDFCECCA